MKSLIAEIDALLRQGQLGQARTKLGTLAADKLSRAETLALAQLCRRADLPHSSIRLLKPYVNNEFPGVEPALAIEVAEYAISLTRLGASRYALTLLDSLPKVPSPTVDFAWAAAFFTRWRYDQAIPYIERYIEAPQITAYERQIGQVNLAAANIFIHNLDRAAELLEPLRADLQSENRILLLTHAFQLSAQIEILRGKYQQAETFLSQGLKLVNDPKSIYSLLSTKWMAVIQLSKFGPTKTNLQTLEDVQETAKQCRHWETVRDCDFFKAQATKDEQLFLKLYFGTPYDPYREKIMTELPKNYQVPTRYSWKPLGKPETTLNLIFGEIEPDGVLLKPDHFNFLLLHALFVDFYSPLSAGTLFCELFPDDVFDPDHSPNRILQHIKRLRVFLKSSPLPMNVVQEQNEFNIIFTRSAEVIVPSRFYPEKIKLIYLRRIFRKWRHDLFSLQECATALAVSRQTMTRILNWGIEQGVIQKVGETSYARYGLSSDFVIP